jgi:hypothetical protein
MTLAGRVNQEPERPKPGPTCGMGKLRTRLEREGKTQEVEGLLELVDAVRRSRDEMPYVNEQRWTGAAVQRVLLEEGHNISRLTVQRHIAFLCACGW